MKTTAFRTPDHAGDPHIAAYAVYMMKKDRRSGPGMDIGSSGAVGPGFFLTGEDADRAADQRFELALAGIDDDGRDE